MRIIILILMAGLIAGCTQRREANPIIIETPPNRLAVGGDLSIDQERFLYNLLDKMLAKPYVEHIYERPIGVDIRYNVQDIENYSSSKTIGIVPPPPHLEGE